MSGIILDNDDYCQQSPTCAELLARNEFPSHVCYEFAIRSVAKFAQDKYSGPYSYIGPSLRKFHASDVKRLPRPISCSLGGLLLVQQWPLPISEDAIRAFFQEHSLTDPPPPALTQRPGSLVGLVVRQAHAFGSATLLGLVKKVDKGIWQFVDSILQVEDWARTKTDVASMGRSAKQLRQWYNKTILGETVRTGRPIGSISLPDFPQRYVDTYLRLASQNHEPPDALEVADELGISEATFYRYLERFHLKWPPQA